VSATQGIGTYFVALTGAWTAVGLLVVHASLPVNPIQLPGVPEHEIALVAPEGWKFFTRNPQEDQTLPFRRSNGEWISASENPNSRADNLFGIDRAGRAQGFELSALLARIGEKAWTPCDGPYSACLKQAESRPVHMTFRGATLCGEIGIVARPPIPWAWSRSSVQPQMPARVVRVEVTC